jgi:hypothetical protein
MSKLLPIGLFFILSVAAVAAKQLPGLYYVTAGTQPTSADYNALVEHVQELERKVAGMQKQITGLHSRLRTKGSVSDGLLDLLRHEEKAELLRSKDDVVHIVDD